MKTACGKPPYRILGGDDYLRASSAVISSHVTPRSEYHQVVQVIGNLVFDLLGIRIFCSYDDLSVLLSDLLQDLVDSLIEEIVRVRTFFRMFLPVLNDIVNILENMQRIRVIIGSSCEGPVEAASVAGVAGCADLGYFGKDRIVVAVDFQLFHILEMPARLSLDPEALAAAGEIRHFAGLECLFKAHLIHVSQHKDFIVLIILNNNWHKTLLVCLHLRPVDGGR